MKHGVTALMDSSHFSNRTFSVYIGGKNYTTKVRCFQISSALFCRNLSPTHVHLLKFVMALPGLRRKPSLLEQPTSMNQGGVTKPKAIMYRWNIKGEVALKLAWYKLCPRRSFKLDVSTLEPLIFLFLGKHQC